MRIPSRARLSELIGSRSALSWPVIAAFFAVGFALGMASLRLLMDEPWPTAALKALSAVVVPCGLLLVVRAMASRRGWMRPRVGLVIVSLTIAALLRSPIGLGALTEWDVFLGDDADPIGRTVMTLFITLAISLTLGASVHLARERAEARALLLAEQARLRELVEATDESLAQAESELRAKANELLEPTISEIRMLLRAGLSDAEAKDVSARITEVVNQVVRPTTGQIAVATPFVLRALDPEKPAVFQWLLDRLDVTKAIRPGFVALLGWLILAPGILIVGPNWQVLGISFLASMCIVLVLNGVKALWPRRLRRMPVVLGLALLAILYVMSVWASQGVAQQFGGLVIRDAAWSTQSWRGVVLWGVLAFLVSVLAMLDEHGRQNRLSLAELNVQLEEVLARLRRESWLLHRTVALAVHGPVQSALVATAMRLSASDRTEDSINDARRRLDAALTAIEHDHHEVPSISDALADLAALWTPIVQIRADVWPSAESRLLDSQGLRRCVIEICREATSNSIRHGQATVVGISLIGMGDTIVLRVSDDGDGVASDPIPGLGEAMFDDTCLRWTLLNRPEGGAELTAYVV